MHSDESQLLGTTETFMSFIDKLTQLAYQVRTRFMRVPGLRLKLRYGHKNQIQY